MRMQNKSDPHAQHLNDANVYLPYSLTWAELTEGCLCVTLSILCCFRQFNREWKHFFLLTHPNEAHACTFIHQSRGIHIDRWYVSSKNVIRIKNYWIIWWKYHPFENGRYKTNDSTIFSDIHYYISDVFLSLFISAIRLYFIFFDNPCFSRFPNPRCDYRKTKRICRRKRNRNDCVCHSTLGNPLGFWIGHFGQENTKFKVSYQFRNYFDGNSFVVNGLTVCVATTHQWMNWR